MIEWRWVEEGTEKVRGRFRVSVVPRAADTPVDSTIVSGRAFSCLRRVPERGQRVVGG